MRTLNLSGLKALDSFSISVSQGALTAGPYSVGAWGGGGGGGTITITAGRTPLMCAPDSVRFSVDLSAATFDTAGPTGSETYDARMHDLIYLWDFDDPGTYAKLEKNLAAHRNSGIGKGPIEAHTYKVPGTYNPSVLVIEPSSGKTATATLSGGSAITVLDPGDVYPGAQTICINPVGDSDFSAKPTGAQEYNSDTFLTSDDVWTDQMPATLPLRFLFKGGETFTSNIAMGYQSEVGFRIDSYGTGKANLDPHLTVVNDGNVLRERTCFFSNNHINKPANQYVFCNLKSVGGHNPLTANPADSVTAGLGSTFVRFYQNVDATTIISDCEFDGFALSTIYIEAPASANVVHIDDCSIANFGGQYPILIGGKSGLGSWHIISGARIAQVPGAYSVDGRMGGAYNNGFVRAPIRLGGVRHQIVKNCDLYHEDVQQPCIKLSEGTKQNGEISSVHSNAMEGQHVIIRFNGNYSQNGVGGGTASLNAVIDSNLLCATHSTEGHIVTWASGLTIRNNIMYVPDQPADAQRFSKFVHVAAVVAGPHGDEVMDPPIRVEFNTLANDRTGANNATSGYLTPWVVYDSAGGSFNIVQRDNINHQPYELVPVTTFAPLTSTEIFVPRSIGSRSGVTGVLDSSIAPLTTMKDFRPDTGSAALGAGTAGVVARDILGTTRTAPADKGAWEA